MRWGAVDDGHSTMVLLEEVVGFEVPGALSISTKPALLVKGGIDIVATT